MDVITIEELQDRVEELGTPAPEKQTIRRWGRLDQVTKIGRNYVADDKLAQKIEEYCIFKGFGLGRKKKAEQNLAG